MSIEVTDEEIEKALLEVLKKQNIVVQDAEKKRKQESSMLQISDLPKYIHSSFCSNIVLIKTKENLCGYSGGTNNLDQRIIISFYNLFRKGLLTCGSIQDKPYPPKFSLTDKGREKLDNLS